MEELSLFSGDEELLVGDRADMEEVLCFLFIAADELAGNINNKIM